MRKLLKYFSCWMLNFTNPLVSILALVDRRSVISTRVRVNRFAKLSGTTIQSYSYVGPRTQVANADIGKFCSISWDCNIGLASHYLYSLSTSPIFFQKQNGTGSSWVGREIPEHLPRTIIGSDVWIGARAILLAGIKVGHGGVIGAGAVVTKDVPPYAITVGTPARIIGYRFPEEVIQTLLKKRWWECSDHEIRSRLHIFQKDQFDLTDIDLIPTLKKSELNDR